MTLHAARFTRHATEPIRRIERSTDDVIGAGRD